MLTFSPVMAYNIQKPTQKGGNGMAQVFISYSSKDAGQANEIVKALESRGIRCWIAPRDIPIGSDYIDEIPGGIDECPFFVVLLSPRAQRSQFVKLELSQALGDGKTIFPLQLGDYAVSRGFMFLLRNTQIRPYFQEKDKIIQEIVTRIGGQVPQSAPVAAPTALELSPEEMYAEGVVLYTKKNYGEAVKLFRKAAEQGHSMSQDMLGWFYDKGYGVPQNYDHAAFWYFKAAEQGDADAQYRLGYFYEHGISVAKNEVIAAEWYRNSAQKGFAPAQTFLAICYEYGKGVPKNLTEAKRWYQKAAEQGDEYAKKALEALQ